MVYRPKAFDAYDVIMCAGPHHNEEIKAMIKIWDMPPKQIINHGYGRLDSIIANYKDKAENGIKKILVAPSWGENGTLELMGLKLIDELMKLPYQVTLRPHPQTIKFSKNTIESIVNKYQGHERFCFEQGVDTEDSLHQSDLMISDWSGAALDYAFGLLKPVLFIDVPRKVQNPNYIELPTEPFESSIRTQVGIVQGTDLSDLESNIEDLINAGDTWHARLNDLRSEHVYHVGNSGQVAAQAILELI
jgi:YidC/Oxa1 family membrane protein insertase